ncbi:MAG: PAS domain-containing protein [Gemmatimonadota bacterium]
MKRVDGDARALGMVLSAVPEVVVVVDLEGIMIYINRVEEGYEREQIMGMQADAVLPPESKATFWAALDSVRRTGATEEYEVEVTTPTGGSEWYRSRMMPIRDDGEVVGAVIMATQISELKAAQAEVEKLRRLLPICSWCDKIQGEEGTWLTVEAHLEKESGTRVSHGMCPDCYRTQLGGGQGNGDRNGTVG